MATETATATKTTDSLAAQVDELGALEKEFAPHAFKARRIEELRKAIRAQYDDLSAFEQFEAKGKRFTVLLGPRGAERRVNKFRLLKAIGSKAFAAVASVTLKALETGVSPEIAATVIDTDRTGARNLRIFELGNPS